jgi:hypothetical protein
MRVEKSTHIRPFAKDDIPPVADLYQRVYLPAYSGARSALLASLERYFEQLFFAEPWQDESISSLVCTDAQGQLAGFVGVTPRRMIFKTRPILLANSFHFMADPNSQVLAGVQLLKALFSGAQDLTFTDHGGDLGRRVWEGLGGSTALLQSLNWRRVLRPAHYARNWACAHSAALAACAKLAKPVCQMADQLLPGLLPHWLTEPDTRLHEVELNEKTLLDCLVQFSASYDLQPAYTMETLHWFLQKAVQFEHHGSLQRLALLDAQSVLAGTFIYYLKTDGPSQVLLLASRKGAYEQVLDHLFRHAWQRGAVELTGRLDPRHMRELTNKRCRFDSAGGWTMVQSRDQELLQTIYRGDAWLSRLEGEWCMLYQPPAPPNIEL